MNQADKEKLERLRQALTAKTVGYVTVTASDLAVCAELVGGPVDEIALSFAKGAAAVRPDQQLNVRADQLRAVLDSADEEYDDAG